MAGRDTDREWRFVTVPYWRASEALHDDVLLGEVPLQTDLPRRIDGVAMRRVGRGGPPPGPFYLSGGSISSQEKKHWLSQLPGARVTVIQTKVEPVGFSVLGQTLVSTVLLPRRYQGCRATGIALGTAADADLARILPTVSPQLEIGVWPVDDAGPRPTREYPRAPQLADALEDHLNLGRVPQPVRLTVFEAAEALFISGDPAITQVEQLRGRDVVVVHTIGKATNLPVVGHAVFSAALIREHAPRSLRSLIVSTARDTAVEAVAREFGVETLTSNQIETYALAQASH